MPSSQSSRFPDLARRRVLVTAGASGIGRAIAERFASEGSEVHICDIDALARSKLSEEQSSIYVHDADVSDPDAVTRLFDQIGENLDVLVNNAGIGGPRAAIDEITDDDWRRTIDVNLTGAFFCLREAARRMKLQRSGRILNISTSSVRTALPFRTPYIVSKAGLMGLTHNAARELGPYGIRVNAILPGYVDNPRGKAITAAIAAERKISEDAVRDEALRFISMRTMIQPSEVAGLAAFLASDEAVHISGQFVGVDGHQEWEG